MDKYINGDICPWCRKEITSQQVENGETFINGGDQTAGILERWHQVCAGEAEEHERKMGIRR